MVMGNSNSSSSNNSSNTKYDQERVDEISSFLLVMVYCRLFVSSGENVELREKEKLVEEQEQERESVCERMI